MKNKIIALILLLSALTPAFAEKIEEKDLTAYLFVYFTGNHISQEAVCYAVSMDGYSYWALNNNKPVIDSKVISSTGGVRDPHILRCEDGKTFYMVVTDMVSDNGWDSNRAMVLLKSTDLVNWSHSVINMQKRYKGQEKLKRVWAPQTIFDPEAGKYMVYWSMKYGNGPDVIYYAMPTPTPTLPTWKANPNHYSFQPTRNRALTVTSCTKTASITCSTRQKGMVTASA